MTHFAATGMSSCFNVNPLEKYTESTRESILKQTQCFNIQDNFRYSYENKSKNIS